MDHIWFWMVYRIFFIRFLHGFMGCCRACCNRLRTRITIVDLTSKLGLAMAGKHQRMAILNRESGDDL